MKNKKSNSSASTLHLKPSKSTMVLLRRLADEERRTMHNLALVALEQGLQQRQDSLKGQPQ